MATEENAAGYLTEFQQLLDNNNFSGLLRLWEEYVAGGEVDGEELCQVLKMIRKSDLAASFGKYVETALPLWMELGDSEAGHAVLRAIVDLQTSNSPEMANLVLETLQKRYGQEPHFNEKLRLIGMRKREQFQGAISNFELLRHMSKGKFVFHTGEWGVGQVMDISLVREQLSLEFDGIAGRKDMSFANAFKTLVPLADDHFLSRRFGDPDALEAEAERDPVSVVLMMLRDLGSLTAADIKEALCDLVVPEEQWSKWWQTTRSKLKKNARVEFPATLSKPFRLRSSELKAEDRLRRSLEKATDLTRLTEIVYQLSRDFPETLRSEEARTEIKHRLDEAMAQSKVSKAEQIEVYFLLDDLQPGSAQAELIETIRSLEKCEKVIENISIVAFKKRALMLMRELRSDWTTIFLNLLFSAPQSHLREYLIKELNQGETAKTLKARLMELARHPAQHPQLFVWYFQKLMADDDLPWADQQGRWVFFEGFFVLYNALENHPEHRDLLKKMYTMASAKRFALVRTLLQHSSLVDAREFLLLVTKCHTLNDHDVQVLHALAQVVHPSLGKKETESAQEQSEVLWTTQDGYNKIRDKIQHLTTVETAQNAKDIETARAHGDLRENAEYKFALERRGQLQGEIKFLSQQFKRARILTPQDVTTDEVGIGTVIEVESPAGARSCYTILGPWDADASNNIISFESKLAKQMRGMKMRDKFTFQNEELTIVSIGRAPL